MNTSSHTRSLKLCLIVVFVAAALAGCSGEAIDPPAKAGHNASAKHEEPARPGNTKLGVPTSLSSEHKELHEQLEAAVNSGGKTGAAAKVVEERLSEHFKKEEEYALPQLALLEELAAGRVPQDVDRAIDLSDKLKLDMPAMLSEHKGIVEALDALERSATEENKAQAVLFTEKLKNHALTEEQVMYPAAILVGEYLKLKRMP